MIKDILSKKDTWIFDMDGTIVDLESLNFRGYAATVKNNFDLELSNEDYQKYFSGSRTADGFTKFLNSKDIKDFDVNKLIDDFRDIKRENLIERADEVVFLKKGIREFLALLKEKNMKTSLATSTIREFTTIVLDHFGLTPYFDVVITAEDVKGGKPNPQIFNMAVEKLASSKDKSVVFEDSKNGIEAAKNAEIFCIGVLTKDLNDSFVTKADYVIEDFDDLVEYLSQ